MKQQQPLQEDEELFDILIVGAGPSAAGLLYGILTRIIKRSNDDSSSTKQENVVMTHQNLRIAILERGCNNNEAACDCSSSISSNFEHSHPVTVSLQNWFQAAHYDSENDDIMCRVPPPRKKQIDRRHFCHPTILHTTTPQSNLSNRIIDVPTGNGYGGGTNINAGLVMRTKYCWHDYFNTADSGTSSSSSASSGGGDFDAWPGMWKGHGNGGRKRSLIMQSMDEIWNVMKANDALITTSTSSSSSSSLSSSGDDEDYDNTGDNDDSSFIGTTTTKASPFQQPTFAAAASSSSSTNNHHRRVNYFTSLITPLLQQHPELYSNVTFLSGVEVERVLIRYACNDDDVRNDHDANKQQQQHQQDEKKISCPCQPQAYAVECNFGSHYGIIRSKREIILCCGAIGTPALLLASGIGMEDDLKEAGIAPWYEHVKCNNHCCGDDDDSDYANHHNIYRDLRVGHQLRDHILLPRVFLSPYQQQSVQSVNSIQGWWMINVPMTDNASSCNNVVDAKMQLQLADGSQMDYMIPHFAAAALRRRWTLPVVDIELSFTWIRWIFHGVRAFLRAFFGIPIFSRWVKSHTTSLNLCLLNPKSVGRVTVKSNDGRLKPYTRLSECKISIDPNYLSDSWDVESLWRGWTFSGRVKQRQLLDTWCIEILPGYILTIGLATYSLVGSTIYWMKVLLGGKMHDDEKETQNNRDDESIPKWFLQYASEFSNPYYHWCGTCAMGGEDGKAGSKWNAVGVGSSVVNEHLCVRGLSNLRVCDASVFPNSVSTPMALTCAALGHAASSYIDIKQY